VTADCGDDGGRRSDSHDTRFIVTLHLLLLGIDLCPLFGQAFAVSARTRDRCARLLCYAPPRLESAFQLAPLWPIAFVAGLLVTCTESPPGHEMWKIDYPSVERSLTDYPAITFNPGDVVTLDAGGCVQSGGFGGIGGTWKRYVNPDDGSGHLDSQ
jgi:hypothetical protein